MSKNKNKKSSTSNKVKQKTRKKTITVTKKEQRIFWITVAIIILLTLIAGYFLIGKLLTIAMGLGIFLILGIAMILDKMNSKPKLRRVLNIIIILFLLLALAGCIGVASFFIYIVESAPEFNIEILNKQESSILYDSAGEEVTRIGKELRENITYDDLPEVFIDALIATEDSRFFQHNGFDAPRFFKASVGQVLGKKNAGGASTLSMQLVKNTYTNAKQNEMNSEGIIRKFTDIYLAVFKLEKNYTKDQIIEFYVNNYDLSSNSYGVEQASQTYFGKSVRSLNLSEAATLVGVFNNPTAYNPLLKPAAAEARRSTVLKLMVRHGYITQEEADMANSIPMTSLTKQQSTEAVAYISYIDTAIDEIMERWGINPYTTSVEIYTNMDRQRQQKIDEIFNGQNSKEFSWKDDKIQAGVAVVEVNTGKIVAVGGGRFKSKPRTTLNRATQANRQIGSTAKPIFDYGPAIEYLNWSPYEQIMDEPWSYSNGKNINNSDREFMGQISMRTALSLSRNIPALKAFQEVQKKVGNKKILEFATNLGIYAEVSNGVIHEAHSLGAFATKNGTTPLQMAAAYSAFANGGTYHEPLSINKIIFRETGEVKNCEGSAHRAMSEATAFMITDMLVTAVDSGLSSGAKVPGVTVAAKTGTSSFTDELKAKRGYPGNAINDAWIVGYDPEYAISMWYGYDEAERGYYNTDIQAVNARSRLYKALGNAIFNKNGQQFKVPNSVVKVGVEAGSNPASLPSASTPEDQIVYEYFLKGNEPTETSAKYNKIATPTGLKVNYNAAQEQIVLTWNKQNTPASGEGYGEFGYKVYYGDVMLGFTKNTTYTINANANISGTYKVTAAFENYPYNESVPAIYDFKYVPSTSAPPTPTPTPTDDDYSLSLNGQNKITITTTEKYTDPDDVNKAVTVLKNGTPTSETYTITRTIKSPSGATISGNVIDGTTTPLEVGNYIISYSVKIGNQTKSITRTITVE
ncbi:MAG: hypothetical protein HFG40_04755 [Bacilli bacterium]|nr:hypothetical protein [Bacilli bacterium]